MQRGANISIKINTTKEFVTDLMNDQDHDMDKIEVTKEICAFKISKTDRLIIF